MARSAALARDRREKLVAILADPDTLGEICGEVAGGATLLDVAQKWDVKYGHLHEWLHDQNYPQRVQAYARAMEARASYIRDRVISQLLTMMGMDIRKAFDAKGRMLPVHKLPDEVAAALQSLEVIFDKKGDKVTKLRSVDKVASTVALGRTQAMFTDKVEAKHSGTLGLADRLESARKRVIEGTATVVEDPPDDGIPKL